MGAEASKSTASSGSVSFASGSTDFPNLVRKDSLVSAWTLLHQTQLEKWKDGHAEAACFVESVLVCDGVLHKDCGFSFCMSRQGIININKETSIFSFRKRSKFAKMAEHFEYNHIPAQLSSIHHFRVKSVLCFKDTLVILHLTRNNASQFGLLDVRLNKFQGVFGRQDYEFQNEELDGEISPDKQKCLIKVPRSGQLPAPGNRKAVRLQLFDLQAKMMLAEIDLSAEMCHFTFDPRFSWKRLAITNFGTLDSGDPQQNSLSLIDTPTWTALRTNERVTDTHSSLYPFMKDLRYTRDGSLLVSTLLDVNCHCRERKSRYYQPVSCAVYIFSADTTETIHCIQYSRYTCVRHNCPINYSPTFSACGNRMALVMNVRDVPHTHFVQIYKLPTTLCLQNVCRIVILQTYRPESLVNLPLPPKLINYLYFKPEYP